MKRTAQLAQLYLAIVAIAGIIFLILHWGNHLPPPLIAAAKGGLAAHAVHLHDGSFLSSVLGENTSNPLSKLILQLIVIVVAASASGSLFARWGQPAVVGEM